MSLFQNKKDRIILILVPNELARGGITNYYYVLRKYFGEHILYLKRGAKHYPYHKSFMGEAIRIIKDYLLVLFYILFRKVELVQTTTSFSKRSMLRDAVFIILAKIFKKKTIIFYRGWDSSFANIASKGILYTKVFLRTDASIVLSEYQKKKLLDWGYTGKIYMETTLVDNELIEHINPAFILNKLNSKKDNKKIQLLFLARLERTKGIFELVDAFQILSQKYNLGLTIAGDGIAEFEVKKAIENSKFNNNIKFTGFVEKNRKIQAFEEADIFVFPSYSEGMPNSVLEAMAFGLPVLTTPVGGLVDFFCDGVNGFYINKRDVISIVEKIEKLIHSNNLRRAIALNNHKYAISHFMASNVAKRNEIIFQEILNLR